MSAWAAKRFWTEAAPEACEGGFTVRLDGRPVKTPARTPLVVPTLGLAQAIAAEWQAQQGLVKPETMPCTRTANSALDKVTPQLDEVAGLVAAYGGTDLLCYRAAGPASLAARQAEAWDPLLGWAAEALQAPLVATAGVMHVPQPAESIARLTARVRALSVFELAAFHDLVAISGSLVLAFAVARGRLDAQTAWTLSRIDESWQEEHWGTDDQARESEAVRHAGLLAAARFYALCG